MIIGIVIRNFKTYKGLNYISLSNGNNFCGLIGYNGIGKSSILEALDCVFNGKEWCRNIDANKSESSYVMPIFVLEHTIFDKVDDSIKIFAEKYSSSVKQFLDNIPNTINAQRKQLWEKLKYNLDGIKLEAKLVLPICLDDRNITDFGFAADLMDVLSPLTNPTEDEKADRDEQLKSNLAKVFLTIKNQITYIYVPKDIDPRRFVKFETEEIQHLIGSNLVDKVKEQLKEDKIKEIATNLRGFVDTLSDSLSGYKFKVDAERQPNIKAKRIYDLIVNEFFAQRSLFKIEKGKDIPLSQLSSGEKQQAITELIHSCVSNYREDNKNLIIAIDEPESALHISLCYEQFQKLFEISRKCMQVLFSSHWYGFIPSVPNGCVVNITKDENNKHNAIVLDIFNYREEIKIGIRNSHGNFPVDITLKGRNDLIQSIISSVINDNYYNWLICEGSSDKVYLEAYLKISKLRIVPVCGCSEVEKIYNHLSIALSDIQRNIQGKVFLLVDTDEDFHHFETKDNILNLRCKRIVNDSKSKTTILVNNQSNPVKKTDIEDVLNGKVFHKVLQKFRENNQELSFLDNSNEDVPEIPSFFAISNYYRGCDYEQLELFFSKDNNKNKISFAKEYVKELQNGDYVEPSWIVDIRNFYNS